MAALRRTPSPWSSRGRDRHGKRRYRHVTFRQLDEDSDRVAAGCGGWACRAQRGCDVGPTGIDFISVAFGLSSGVVTVLIEPRHGPRNLVRFLAGAEPEGFCRYSTVHAIRVLLPGRFPGRDST